MKIIASVTDGDAIQRLDPTQPPRLTPGRPRSSLGEEDFEPRQGTDLGSPREFDQRVSFPPAAGPFPTAKSPPSPSDPAFSIASSR